MKYGREIIKIIKERMGDNYEIDCIDFDYEFEEAVLEIVSNKMLSNKTKEEMLSIDGNETMLIAESVYNSMKKKKMQKIEKEG